MSKKNPTFIDIGMDLYNQFDILSKTTVLGFAERLNSRFTILFLSLAIAFIVPNNYIDSRITCFSSNTPNQKGMFMDLLENYCYINGTIPLLPEDPTPNTRTEWNNASHGRKINYYQWFFVILLIQIFLFKIPGRIWTYFATSQTSTNLEDLITNADNTRKDLDPSEHADNITDVAMEIDRILYDYKNMHKNVSCCSQVWRRIAGGKLSLLYMLVKFFYAINIIVQLCMMYFFMFHSKPFPSISLLNRPGQVDLIFPRNVMCHLPNIIGTSHRNDYVGQCILYLNMYNQLVFTILYYWFMFVSIVTVASIPLFIIQTFRFRSQVDLIKHLLRVTKSYNYESPREKALVKDFTRDHLGCDGVFLIRKLNDNVKHLVAAEILAIIFHKYRMDLAEQKFSNSPVKVCQQIT